MKRSLFLGCAFIATLTLPAAAHAQEAEAAKGTVDAISTGIEVKSVAADCAADLAKRSGDLEALKKWRSVGNSLGKISLAADAVSVGLDIYQGNYKDAATTVATVSVEAKACAILGPQLCAYYHGGKFAYSAGYKFGTVLASIPTSFGGDHTVGTMWGEILGDWYYGSGEPSPAQLQAMVAKHRLKLQELEAQTAKPPPPMCKVKEAKDAVADMLEKAKARTAGQLTSSVPSDLDSLTADAVSSADRASSAATAASAATIQDMNSRMAAQATANAARTQAVDSYQPTLPAPAISPEQPNSTPSRGEWSCDGKTYYPDGKPAHTGPGLGATC